MRLQALRGATTCDANTHDEIGEKTRQLVSEVLARNGIEHDDLVSIIFTATDDLTAEFPATAARALGLGDVPLLSARELAVGTAPCRWWSGCWCTSTPDAPAASCTTSTSSAARSLRDDLPELRSPT